MDEHFIYVSTSCRRQSEFTRRTENGFSLVLLLLRQFVSTFHSFGVWVSVVVVVGAQWQCIAYWNTFSLHNLTAKRNGNWKRMCQCARLITITVIIIISVAASFVETEMKTTACGSRRCSSDGMHRNMCSAADMPSVRMWTTSSTRWKFAKNMIYMNNSQGLNSFMWATEHTHTHTKPTTNATTQKAVTRHRSRNERWWKSNAKLNRFQNFFGICNTDCWICFCALPFVDGLVRARLFAQSARARVYCGHVKFTDIFTIRFSLPLKHTHTIHPVCIAQTHI